MIAVTYFLTVGEGKFFMLAIIAFVFPEWDINFSGYSVISVQQSPLKV